MQDGVGGFLDIIQAFIAEDSPPNVLTTSYGFNEEDFSLAIAEYVVLYILLVPRLYRC